MSAILHEPPLALRPARLLAPMEMHGWWGVLTILFYPALIAWVLIPYQPALMLALVERFGGDGLALLLNLHTAAATVLVLVVAAGIARALVAAYGIWQRHTRVKRWLHTAEIPASVIKDRLTALWDYNLPFVVYRDLEPRAFVLGVFRTRIYVSTRLMDLLNDRELGSVIMHEVHHHRSQDPLKGFLLGILSHLFFYLPAVHSYCRYWNESREWEADAAARRVSDANTLAEALCKILTVSRQAIGFGDFETVPMTVAASPAALHGLGKIRDRIEYLLGLKDPGPWRLSARDLGLSVLSLLAFVLLSLGMASPLVAPAPAEQSASTRDAMGFLVPDRIDPFWVPPFQGAHQRIRYVSLGETSAPPPSRHRLAP